MQLQGTDIRDLDTRSRIWLPSLLHLGHRARLSLTEGTPVLLCMVPPVSVPATPHPFQQADTTKGTFLGPPETRTCSDALSTEQLALHCVFVLSHHQPAALLS